MTTNMQEPRYDTYDHASPEDLLGKTLRSVVQDGDEFLTFTTNDGTVYQMLHFQDCCESVGIESIVGDLQDLVGYPILMAEESSSDGGDTDEYGGTSTWTFYKFATVRGYVDIRWVGSSNGYYSESVDFIRLKKKAA